MVNDGGPAYPFAYKVPRPAPADGKFHIMEWDDCVNPGMSLRAYAAVAAMYGILSGTSAMDQTDSVQSLPPEDVTAEQACRYADALIVELQKGQEP